jgi:hypothetical protein
MIGAPNERWGSMAQDPTELVCSDEEFMKAAEMKK